MFVYRAAPAAGSPFVLVATSGGPDANEVVSATSAASTAAGAKWKVYVHACSVDAPGGSYTLFKWALTSAASNPFTTQPTSSQAVTIGGAVPLPFAWSGLPTGNRYLGRVQFFDAAAPTAQMAATTVAVSTR